MATECFVPRDFAYKTRAVIRQANSIIAEYMEAGYKLTLRQLYYQFVARDLIPNKQSEYKRLGSIINDARLAGLIDWEAIEDRTRNIRKLPSWSSPQSILNAVAEQYREDAWSDQPTHVEAWIEKDALLGVIENVCEEWRVPFFACRGYTSQSEQYDAGKRFSEAADAGQHVIVLHLGDHDPSGIDMTRDNQDRLSMFTGYAGAVEVRRLALNFDQVERFDPPPNPAKATDSRFEGYVDSYGESCWELDALDPKVIGDLIRDEIEGIVDHDAWQASMDREAERRENLVRCAKRWPDVVEFLAA
jgi:hypothetical protein